MICPHWVRLQEQFGRRLHDEWQWNLVVLHESASASLQFVRGPISEYLHKVRCDSQGGPGE